VADGRSKAREIDLGNDFGDVVVKVNGATIEVGAASHVIVSRRGGVALQTAANDSAGKSGPALQIGDLDDGGVYVGLSAENDKPLHAAVADLPDYKTYEEALAAAVQLKALRPTAHVPTPKELDKNLFDNRNAGHLKGTFNTSGSHPASIYRSFASNNDGSNQVQCFDRFGAVGNSAASRLPVRLVW
jgi:hypothetical protein